MSKPEKIIKGGAGLALIMFGPTPNLKLLGAALLLGALTPDPVTPGIEANLLQGRTVSGIDPVGEGQVIYGQCRVGGIVSYRGWSGSKREYLDTVVTLARHEVEEIGDLYLGEELVPLDGSGNATGKFAGYVSVEKKLGADDQTALTNLQSYTLPAWVGEARGARFSGYTGQFGATASNSVLAPATMTLELRIVAREAKAGCIASFDGSGGWRLSIDASRQVVWRDGAGVTLTSAAIPLDEDTAIAVVAQASGMALYVTPASQVGAGGVDLAASTGTAYTRGSTTGVLRVASLEGTTGFFAGEIDDIQIWNAARTTEEIASDFDAPEAAQQATRVGYWPFSENSGATVDDVEQDGLDITLQPAWTSNHRQRGCALAHVRLLWEPTLFPGGEPNISFVVKGRKVRDPRTSPATTAWSANWALCLADYLTNADFGLGCDATADLDSAALVAAANIADEDVDLNDGGSPPGTEKRYTVNGAFTTDRAPQSIIEQMLAAGAGYVAHVGGQWLALAGAWRVPTVTLTPADFRSAPSIDTLVPRRENFNAVKGIYVEPDFGWQPTDFTPVTNATYEALDNDERVYHDTSFPFTTSTASAQRLAKIRLERQRQAIGVRVKGRTRCALLQPGDNCYLTWSLPGWSAKAFEVIDAQWTWEGEPPELGCDLVLRESAAAIYDWSQEETQVDLAPNSALPNPFLAAAPEALTLASGTAVLGVRLDGTVFSRIKASWRAPEDQFVQQGGRIEIQYRTGGSPAGSWLPHEFVHGSQTESFILDVIDGGVYDVRARSINSMGAASGWVTVTGHTVIGKTEPPSDVASFSGQQINDTSVTFRWGAVADADLGGYELRFGPTDGSWETAQPIAVGQSTRISANSTIVSVAVFPSIRPAGGALQPWRFYIKAVDTTGNESVTAATFDLVIQPTYDALVREASWPVWAGTLSNLVRNPATGNLNMDSQSLADGADFNVFNSYVYNPYTSGSYTAPEIDTGGDDRVRIWGEPDGFMGPGETGSANLVVSIDYRESTTSYDGFEDWTVGEVTARYIQHKLTIESADGLEVITEFVAVADLQEHDETATAVIAAGGTDVAFTRDYRLPPDFDLNSVTDGGSPATTRYGQFAAVTATGVRVWVFNSAGADVGGTINYTATGV